MNITYDTIFFGIAIIFVIFNIWFFYKIKKIKVQKQQQLEQQQRLKEQNKQLIKQKQQQIKQLDQIKNTYSNYLQNIIDKKQQVEYLNSTLLKRQSEIDRNLDKFYNQQKDKIDKKLNQYKTIVHQAANSYIDTLQKGYETAEAAYKTKMIQIQESMDRAAADLQALKDTRKAAYEAILKQKQIKQNKNNYRLIPASVDLQDIYALEHIKQSLHKPRILSMLIWQTYWQPLAKEKFPIILQDKTKTGIYKITNVNTDQSYIGQSLDIYKRWTDHCKAGLGIDTPAGNKLYKSIQEYGLQNFTFELLCECPKNQLNDKEKYFIQLYQADVYGFNGNAGNR